jgi:hypothetical protein
VIEGRGRAIAGRAVFRARRRFADDKIASEECLSVAALEGLLRYPVIHLHEAESARAASEMVDGYVDGVDIETCILKPVLQFRFTDLRRKIADV